MVAILASFGPAVDVVPFVGGAATSTTNAGLPLTPPEGLTLNAASPGERLTSTDEPAAGSQAAASSTDTGPTPVASPYVSHVVQPGDTLNAIAAAYGVGLDYILWNNPELGSDPDTLIIGASLLVPSVDGLVYDVRLGDTINDIAAAYGVDPTSVIGYGPNNLTSPDTIIEGMVLVIPGAVQPAPPPVEAEPDIADPDLPAVVADPADPIYQPAGVAAAPPAAPEIVYVASIGYAWPISGTFWSGFGPRWGSFHKGIDLGADYGSGIAAAASGQVILSTYSDNGYGNYVIVRHDDGSETLYAHMSERYVSLGQYVNQGEILGAVGCTGWCQGNHLHFEIHIGGSPVNPLNYLP